MNKNNVKSYFVIFVLMVIIVGGFIAMKYSEVYFNKSNQTNNKIKETEIKDIRIDNTKEYIYFENNDQIVSELDIEYKDIVINFEDSNGIANLLNTETKKFKDALTYDETIEDAAYNKLKNAEYKIYDIYYFDNYISLVVKYYKYDPENLVSFVNSKAYVFNKADGKLYTSSDILTAFNITEDTLKDKVKTFVEDAQLLKEEEKLDVDATLNNLGDYALYIDKMGKLSLSIIVKSDLKDYNDVVVLN